MAKATALLPTDSLLARGHTGTSFSADGTTGGITAGVSAGDNLRDTSSATLETRVSMNWGDSKASCWAVEVVGNDGSWDVSVTVVSVVLLARFCVEEEAFVAAVLARTWAR